MSEKQQSDTHALASEIKFNREQKKYSQQELADLAGVSLRTIQRLEKGEVVPRPFTLRQIYTILEIPDSQKSNTAQNLRSIVRIQYLAVLLPLTNLPLAYFFYKRFDWASDKNKAASLLSLTTYSALLIPALVIVCFLIIKSFGLPTFIKQFPTPLIAYEIVYLIYLFILEKLVGSKEELNDFSKLKSVPNLFKTE